MLVAMDVKYSLLLQRKFCVLHFFLRGESLAWEAIPAIEQAGILHSRGPHRKPLNSMIAPSIEHSVQCVFDCSRENRSGIMCKVDRRNLLAQQVRWTSCNIGMPGCTDWEPLLQL